MSLGSYLGSYVLSTSPSVPGCPWIQCAYVLFPLYLPLRPRMPLDSVRLHPLSPSVPPLSPSAAFDSLECLIYEGHDRSGPPRSHDTGDAAAPPHKQCVVQVVLGGRGEEEGGTEGEKLRRRRGLESIAGEGGHEAQSKKAELSPHQCHTHGSFSLVLPATLPDRRTCVR